MTRQFYRTLCAVTLGALVVGSSAFAAERRVRCHYADCKEKRDCEKKKNCKGNPCDKAGWLLLPESECRNRKGWVIVP